MTNKFTYYKKIIEKLDYYYLKDSTTKSFWTDLPITMNNYKTINCVIEIPQNKISKFQVNKYVKNHPISQDLFKRDYNILRFYPQFLLFNYGYIPQTYETSLFKNKYSDIYKGDEDPLDICELSGKSMPRFELFEAKVLSAICLIDQDEIDWKLLVMNVQDCEKYNINTIDDYNKLFPNKINYIINWFKYIKFHEGKKVNNFIFEDKIFNKSESTDIIKYYNEGFNKLLHDDIFKNQRKLFHIDN